MRRSLTAAHGRVVIDVWNLIIYHFSTIISISSKYIYPMWIDKLLVMHLNGRGAQGSWSIRWKRWVITLLISVLIHHLRLLVWDTLWYTFILIFGLISQFSIEITCKRRVHLYKLSNSFLISIDLIFQKFTVSQIYVELKFIYLKALHHAGLNITEKIRHFINTILIFYIYKISFCWFPAVLALTCIFSLHREACLAEDTVTIKNKSTDSLKASLTLITMQLRIFVHRILY